MKPDWSARRTRAYRERRRAAVEQRKREHLERIWRDVNTGFDRMPPTKVMVPWHVDETGCRARTVGCD